MLGLAIRTGHYHAPCTKGTARQYWQISQGLMAPLLNILQEVDEDTT